jgi:hypothetical protein
VVAAVVLVVIVSQSLSWWTKRREARLEVDESPGVPGSPLET